MSDLRAQPSMCCIVPVLTIWLGFALKALQGKRQSRQLNELQPTLILVYETF